MFLNLFFVKTIVKIQKYPGQRLGYDYMGKKSKKKRARHTQQKKPTKPLLKQGWLSKLRSIFSPRGYFVGWLIVFLAVVTSYYTFAFKLSITPSIALDSLNPFSTPFILLNDSLLWINLVNPYKMTLYKVIVGNSSFDNCGTQLIKPSIPILTSGESTSFMLPFNQLIYIADQQYKYADVEINISYYPAFFPFFNIFERHYKKRFIAIPNKNGILQWEHKALSE